jgi:hypothetical protein
MSAVPGSGDARGRRRTGRRRAQTPLRPSRRSRTNSPGGCHLPPARRAEAERDWPTRPAVPGGSIASDPPTDQPRVSPGSRTAEPHRHDRPVRRPTPPRRPERSPMAAATRPVAVNRPTQAQPPHGVHDARRRWDRHGRRVVAPIDRHPLSRPPEADRRVHPPSGVPSAPSTSASRRASGAGTTRSLSRR